MYWADTTSGLLKQRNAADSAWIDILTLSTGLPAGLGTGDSPTFVNVAAVNTAKAWVNFNGTGTVAIRDSYNVSSITDVGAGQYAVNFSTAMANVNYSTTLGMTFGASLNPAIVTIEDQTTALVKIIAWNQNNAAVNDSARVCVTIFSS